MSRTRRKYNDPRKRIFWVMFEKFWNVHLDKETGTWIYLPPGQEEYDRLKKSVLCMGKCPMCRDHKLDNVKRAEKSMMLDLAVKTVSPVEIEGSLPG